MNVSISGLKQALPYVRLYRGKTFVIKVGGGVLAGRETADAIAEQTALISDLGIMAILVHGGGPQLTELGRRLGLKPEIVAGRRVTDDATLDAAKMVYSGKLNIDLVAALSRHGVRAVGLSGVDGRSIAVARRPPVDVRDDAGVERRVDFGHVGDIRGVDVALLRTLLERGYVPVLSCLSADDTGAVLNVNADGVAEAVAVALEAEKLIFVTQTRGLLRDKDDESTLIPFADQNDLEGLLAGGAVVAGMRPKVEACIRAATNGVRRTHIISGLVPDALLIEVFTGEGCGTMVVGEREKRIYQETELA